MKKVIMLPLSKQPQFAYAGEISSFSGQLQIISEQYANHGTRMSRGAAVANHLYIIDTEAEIVEGDWCIEFNSLGIIVVSVCKAPSIISGECILKKVVATTDKSLGLLLINKEFIQLFVEKHGEINEVDVEFSFEEDTTKDYIIGVGQPAIKFAIVTPKESDDVESVVKQLPRELQGTIYEDAFKAGLAWQKERSYSRDDVAVLIKNFIQFYTSRPEGSKKLSGVGQWLIDHKLEDK